MSAFDQAVGYVLEDEGGYVNDPTDPGGETNFGISRTADPDLPIAHLTEDDAKNIYFRDYWMPAGCAEVPPPIAYALLDGAVNMGVRPAVRHLQYAVGAEVDGILGPVTKLATWEQPRDSVLERMLAKRCQGYAEMAQVHHYGAGWFARVVRVHRRAITAHWEG